MIKKITARWASGGCKTSSEKDFSHKKVPWGSCYDPKEIKWLDPVHRLKYKHPDHGVIDLSTINRSTRSLPSFWPGDIVEVVTNEPDLGRWAYMDPNRKRLQGCYGYVESREASHPGDVPPGLNIHSYTVRFSKFDMPLPGWKDKVPDHIQGTRIVMPHEYLRLIRRLTTHPLEEGEKEMSYIPQEKVEKVGMKADHPIEILKAAYRLQRGDIAHICMAQTGTGSTQPPIDHGIGSGAKVVIVSEEKPGHVYTIRVWGDDKIFKVSILNLRPTGQRLITGPPEKFDLSRDSCLRYGLEKDILRLEEPGPCYLKVWSYMEFYKGFYDLLELCQENDWEFKVGCVSLRGSSLDGFIEWLDQIGEYRRAELSSC